MCFIIVTLFFIELRNIWKHVTITFNRYFSEFAYTYHQLTFEKRK